MELVTLFTLAERLNYKGILLISAEYVTRLRMRKHFQVQPGNIGQL